MLPLLRRGRAAALLLSALLLAGIPALAQEGPPSPLAQEGLDPAGRPRYVGTLTLQDALGLGLRENLAIALGQAEARMAAAETAEAAAMGRPKLSIGATAATGDAPMIWPQVPGVMPGFVTSLPPDAVSLNASVMVPVLTGGLFRARLEAAEFEERAALARAALSLRQAGRDIRAAYYGVQGVRAELTVAEWELQQQQEILRLAREQLETGRVARVVVLRAEAEAAAAEGRLARVLGEIAEAEAELKVALGVSVTSRFEYPGMPEEPPLQGTEDEDLATALSDRPDLVAARFAVEAGDRRIAEAVAEFSPQVYAMGMAERMQDPRMVSGGYQVGLGLAFPVYDGGERAARLDRARGARDAAGIEVERREQEATGQVVASRARLAAALQELELAEREVVAAEEGLRIARLRHEAGRGIQLEILDAVAALSRARSARAEAAARSGQARADLLYATGRY